MKEKIFEFEYNKHSVSGQISEACKYVTDNQLKSSDTWHRFANQFRNKSDSKNLTWRGEFWGKTMRGACMAYRVTKDRGLYEILERTAIEILDSKDERGIISTYDSENEFCNWDLWCRKYVLLGLTSFYDICDNADLKKRIENAIVVNTDYIIEHIGSGSGKKEITETCGLWGAVNSCSILIAVVAAYNLTKNKKYLDFADYIVSRGGVRGDNLIEVAYENKKKPSEYPVVKAYEVMSFFEGLSEYYKIVKNEKYLKAVCNFIRSVNENEITVIGCAGCSGEVFNNGAISQTEYSEIEMQETCVAVTWMLFCSRLYKMTANVILADYIEKTYYNALLGAVNYENNPCYAKYEKKLVKPLPFDSYSPLVSSARGKAVGGYQELGDGGAYGCCASIGAAGVFLIPLDNVMEKDDGLVITYYCDGINEICYSGIKLKIITETCYPADGLINVSIESESELNFNVYFRIPACANSARAFMNGVEKTEITDGFARIPIEGKKCSITLDFDIKIKELRLNGKKSFAYGPICLAFDKSKNKGVDSYVLKEADINDFVREKPESGESIRFSVKCGEKKVILTDYCSCGRKWSEKDSIINVWF